ncbi:wall-associated receptor kinase-like 20 [Cannabis sativa]|uniref:wall-associated receptor kinase-like 20 n=1 Tax=Cannabis sativa TaxID=3483 RepID=UPI0029C9D858|nr:wall-associated receptor kinase-like 20 [Cannabis sativa]
MENNTRNLFFLLTLFPLTCLSLSRAPTPRAANSRQCENCGPTLVPYPLSTRPGCGDYALYKIRCTAGALWLDTVNESAYPITSVNPVTRRLTIRPAGIAANSCVSTDFRSRGIQLDHNSSFKVAAGNTILLLNCTNLYVRRQRPPVDCTANGLCHRYVKDNLVVPCMKTASCCSLKVGVSNVGEYGFGVKIGGDECSAYQSFVTSGPAAMAKMPAEKWPEPEMELEWGLPSEPICEGSLDCMNLMNSKCLVDPVRVGQKRCFCDIGFKWDPMYGLCAQIQTAKCSIDRHGKGCKIMKKKKSKKIAELIFFFFLNTVLAGAVCGVVPTIIVMGILLYKKLNQSNSKKEAIKTLVKERELSLQSKTSGKSARIFTGKEIVKATNNFCKSNLVGSGGFGEVFKGIFDDGTITAIKRAKFGNTKGTEQILNEVRILCQVNHRRLVRLLGCCVDLDLPLLISEFIPNGTLFDHLHCHSSKKYAPIKWILRLQIAHQTAEGLAYLHSAAMPPIYHRDVKSSNILLDEKLDAKISDFGLSRLVEEQQSKANNNNSEIEDNNIFTCAQGTLGYLDPEYHRNFQLTDKSDVYSFGVVLLEILTAMKAIDFNRDEEDVNLAVYVKKMIKEERLMEAVDPMLKEGSSKIELETMKALGLLAAACLNDQRQNRPSMKEVADEIEYLITIVSQTTKFIN